MRPSLSLISCSNFCTLISSISIVSCSSATRPLWSAAAAGGAPELAACAPPLPPLGAVAYETEGADEPTRGAAAADEGAWW